MRHSEYATSSTDTRSKPLDNEFEDLIYLISHDVRTSVRALIELPQWIADDLAEAGVKLEGSVGDSIALMNVHTGRLDRMLADLLTFSRVGRMQDVRDLAADEMLTDVLDDMRVPAEFKITTDLLTNRLVIGEKDGRTLVSELITNAIKHHDRRTGRIHLTLAEKDGQVTLTVRDDGPGVPVAYHDRVFAAMTTLRPRDEVEGSGMGLAIVRKIAQFYGGDATLLVDSAERGTTVVVQLPTVPSDARAQSDAKADHLHNSAP